jgi:hypothetical protein
MKFYRLLLSLKDQPIRAIGDDGWFGLVFGVYDPHLSLTSDKTPLEAMSRWMYDQPMETPLAKF